MYKTQDRTNPISISSLKKGDIFVLSKFGAPTINENIYLGVFFDMCHSITKNGTPRLHKPQVLVYPLKSIING